MAKRLFLINILLAGMLFLTGCQKANVTFPPMMFYQGESSQDWIQVNEIDGAAEKEGIGTVYYQDTEGLTRIGVVPQSLENHGKLKEDFAVNLSGLIEAGAPVYEVILENKAWFMVEGIESASSDSIYYGCPVQYLFRFEASE